MEYHIKTYLPYHISNRLIYIDQVLQEITHHAKGKCCPKCKQYTPSRTHHVPTSISISIKLHAYIGLHKLVLLFIFHVVALTLTMVHSHAAITVCLLLLYTHSACVHFSLSPNQAWLNLVAHGSFWL